MHPGLLALVGLQDLGPFFVAPGAAQVTSTLGYLISLIWTQLIAPGLIPASHTSLPSGSEISGGPLSVHACATWR